MLDMLKRHQIQVLRDAGHSQQEVAKLATVSVRSVRRVEAEVTVTSTDLSAGDQRVQTFQPELDSLQEQIVTLLQMRPADFTT
jgi:hypothetical protein